ncbi:hypothetical protein H257_18707 [Aphanomyces astaci]|uniref:Uncharacterized protein n=1 Tax=Aphanomyces astaci TaxID=112090 RepID=W4FCD6_APHAT|nr:hypothetical protein H257_18707 [Aphanomyces astaci]ETV64393.1 hypothetical protein H257_18707 [Aphanomyces astaci]|eukprot:XP_009846126.1 hypothetical protein H257_18707 [Aphanomyces astaci]
MMHGDHRWCRRHSRAHEGAEISKASQVLIGSDRCTYDQHYTIEREGQGQVV